MLNDCLHAVTHYTWRYSFTGFSYGKKNDTYYLLSGMGLLVYPYFVEKLWTLLLVGIVLTAAPFLLKMLIR